MKWIAFWFLLAAFPREARTAALPPSRIRVITTFFPAYVFTLNVARDLADVQMLLPPGMGPHEFQFSRREMQLLGSADLIVRNGLGLESWLDRALRQADGQKSAAIVELAAGLSGQLITDVPHLHRPEEKNDHGLGARPNPHIWLDPQLVAHGVTNILRALQAADATHAASYAFNAAAFTRSLEQLDRDIRVALEPVSHRAIISDHDAFPYFARRYGLQILGVIEEIPGVEPSPRHLTDLARTVRDHHIPVLFTEPQFSPRQAARLASDLKVAVARLDTLETGPLRPEAYEQAMRQNLKVLLEYLR